MLLCFQVLPWSSSNTWRTLKYLRVMLENLRLSCLVKMLRAPGSLEKRKSLPVPSMLCPPAEEDILCLLRTSGEKIRGSIPLFVESSGAVPP